MKNRYFKIGLIVFVATLIIASLFQVVFAGDQIKTSDFFVGTYAGSLSTNTDFPFVIYLGDDLTGVSGPVKSALFSISGVYTGGGSLQLQIDSDPASARTFMFPTVSNPTDFDFIYNDFAGKLNHSSAGVYSHTLNIIPSGITISNLGAKLNTTHQFAPTSCADGQPTNQKVKTSEFFVGSYTSSFDGSAEAIVSAPFSVYIGDDISGIANPIKSFYFVVSGVYTGSGTLDMSIGNLGAGTTTSFSLANSTNPKNFSFIYNDSYGQINPTSAGTYNYNLNLGISGPTVSNLAIKAVMTHRYKPVSCGSGYPPYGDLVSTVFDSTANADGPAYNSIMWQGKLGGASLDQGKVKFQIAASDSSSGPWNYYGGSTCGSNDWYEAAPDTAIELVCHPQVNNKRYFRYKIRICSNDCTLSGTETPQVDGVIVNWSP
jgi:hypothetical protein